MQAVKTIGLDIAKSVFLCTAHLRLERQTDTKLLKPLR
jgi:hypothetical protein